MPSSHPEGRDWVAERIAATTAPIILDVGCGLGTYSDLARHLRPDARWIGLDIFAPYVERYDLLNKYDEVVITDLRSYVLPSAPVVILAGDVLEHLPREDAEHFLRSTAPVAREVMVSVPIIEYPQGELEGNIHETHLYDWGFDEMAAQLPGCETWKGQVVGRFWWRNTIAD